MSNENGAQEALDTRALEVATKALTKIEEHEKNSETLWNHMNLTLDKINKNIKQLYDWRHKVYQCIIVALLGICAWLLINSDKVQFISHG